VQILPSLTVVELRQRLPYDIPSVEEVKRELAHGTEQGIAVPYNSGILNPAHLVGLAVPHDEDHGEAWGGAFICQLDGEEICQLCHTAGFASEKHIVAHEEVHSSAKMWLH
jgi:hypothetical protein